MDVNFRAHDFFLGRNNARNFVRYFFSLPFDENNPVNNHPIHRNWTKESIERYKIKKGKRDPETGKRPIYLPIIPDLNIVLKDLGWAGEEWNIYTYKEKPKFNPQVLFDLEGKIRKRYEKLITVLLQKATEALGGDDQKNPLTKEWLDKKNRKGFFGRLTSAIARVTTAPLGRGIFKFIQSKAIQKAIDKMTEATIKMILKDLENKGVLEEPD